MINTIVLATSNQHKVAEFRHILSDFPLEIRSLADFGPIPPVVEDGETFDDNAYKKAHHTARVLGLPAIADDSGLVVPSLGNEPGVRSARYAGENATDDENIFKLLQKIKTVKDKKAYFQCVISIAVPSGPALTYEGRCDGFIIDHRRGLDGFGYDPIFYINTLAKTFAEVSMDEKNRISHRGKALAEIKDEADKIVKWLKLRLEEEKKPRPDHSAFLDNDFSS